MVSPITIANQVNQAAGQTSAPGTIGRITQAIKTAAARTGVDFSYLLNKASQESSLNPNAQASSSSASGLFQFTSQTWLQTVKTYGAQFGLGNYANQISVDANGVAHVSDPKERQAILALRKDPTISAEMAGELDQQNFAALKSNVGGTIGPTDLYLAHFLGATGASDFISKMRSNPSANAASILPQAASANPAVFYNADGQPRSVSQIYQQFAQKFDNAPQNSPVQVASNTSAPVTSFNVANTGNFVASNYMPPVMNGGRPNTSSLYQAMVLAQLNMHESGLASLGMTENGNKMPIFGYEHNKKGTPISVLGEIA